MKISKILGGFWFTKRPKGDEGSGLQHSLEDCTGKNSRQVQHQVNKQNPFQIKDFLLQPKLGIF